MRKTSAAGGIVMYTREGGSFGDVQVETGKRKGGGAYGDRGDGGGTGVDMRNGHGAGMGPGAAYGSPTKATNAL